jgi:hypothetical protein
VLLFTGIAAPLAGLGFRRVAGGWDSIGKGPLAIDQELPPPRYLRQPEPAVDPAIQDAELRDEVRQLVIGRNERRMRRGLEPLDVEAETERQLADFVGSR